MDAAQLRDRRMNQALDEIINKEADDFHREAVERRKAEKRAEEERTKSKEATKK